MAVYEDGKFKNEEYAQLGGINSKASQYTTGPHEFLNIVNMDFSAPGALKKRPGSTLYIGATVTGQVIGLYEFMRLNGFSQILATANTNLYYLQNNTFNVVKTGLLNNGIPDFSTFVDRLFYANGQDFFKYDGTNTFNYSLPNGFTAGVGLSATVGGGLSGTYVYSYGFLNNRGYYGPGSPGVTVVLNGITFGSVTFSNLSAPAGFGVSAYAFYRTSAGGVDLFRIGTTDVGASTFTDGSTYTLTSSPVPSYLYFTAAPKYLEIYNNQMMMAGFSSMLSTLYFSDIGEPEGVPPVNFVEVRTNDGDRILAIANYNGVFLIFKERSFHRLSGDNPINFQLTEISTQYGCLSNRAVVVFENICFFLDRKGIVSFNGANIEVVSTKIEPIFARMNVDAAKENAVAIHNRLRNEVWFSFPVDGSLVNNMTVVYDYVVQAWTTFQGFNPSSLQVMRGSTTAPTAFYGSTGIVANFADGLTSDVGRAINCVIKSRFLADMGNSIEKSFRRLYMDVVPVIGYTSAIGVNFYSNYSSAIGLTRIIYQAPFQSRIDYGISAKSLAVEFINSTTTDTFQLNGYTIEFREQRRV